MDFTVFLIIAVALLVISLVGYVITTNHIISEQEKELEELRKEACGDKITVEYINKPNSNIPEYGNF